jgi:hypothetical protein
MADPPQPHGPYWQWARKVAARTVCRWLEEDQAADLMSWVANGRRLHELVSRLEAIGVAAVTVETDPRSPRRAGGGGGDRGLLAALPGAPTAYGVGDPPIRRYPSWSAPKVKTSPTRPAAVDSVGRSQLGERLPVRRGVSIRNWPLPTGHPPTRLSPMSRHTPRELSPMS